MARKGGPAAGQFPGRVLLVAPQPFFTVAGTPINVLQVCRMRGWDSVRTRREMERLRLLGLSGAAPPMAAVE